MGVALGEAGVGIGFENAELAHALGFAALVVILAEGGLTTSWRECGRRCGSGCRWRRSASRCQRGASSRVGAHFLLGLRWQLGGAARCGHVADGRGGGLLGAAAGAAPAAAGRRARGRVRPQRRPDRRAGHADRRRARWPTTVSLRLVGDRRLRARRRPGRRAGGRLRRRLADAPGRPAVVGPLPARRAGARGPGVRRGRRRCTRPGSPRSTSPRWCWATPSCRTARPPGRSPRASAWLAQIGLFVMLGLLLSPGRITLDARSAIAVVAGLVLTFVARPLSVLVGARRCSRCRWREQAFLSLGRAARSGADRARHHPARRGRARRRAALRHRVRARRGLHAGHRRRRCRWVARRAAGWPAAPSPATSRSRRRRSSGSPPTCSR